MPQEVHVTGPWWHLFCVITELKQPHCSPRSAAAMDTAESQANGHTSVVLCCAPLQSRAPLQPQSWGRMLPSSLLQQGQLTGGSGQGQQHALGRSSGSGDASGVQSSTGSHFPIRVHRPAMQPSLTREPPKLAAYPGNVPAAPALPRTAALPKPHQELLHEAPAPGSGRLLHPTRPFVKNWLAAKRNIF